jgi:hypothetical protein
MSNVTLESVLMCPQCGVTTPETMPTDACQFFYECPSCHTVLRPKPGDCCVFCSYGSTPCPPIQQQRGRCLSKVLAYDFFRILVTSPNFLEHRM